MILVTGASGHLGANLVRRLLAEKEHIRVLWWDGDHSRAFDGLPVERVVGDLRDPRTVDRAFRACAAVYHCAALVSTTNGQRREIYTTNVTGTRHVLAAVRTTGARVVVTGSIGTICERPDRPSTEDDQFYPFQPHTPYTVSKLRVEHECLGAAVEGVDVVMAVSTAIIGPHDYRPSRLGKVLLDVANGRRIIYPPGGFEFVSVDDLVDGHLRAMRRDRAGRKYLLSTEFHTMDQLLDLFGEVSGRPAVPLRVPAPVMAALADRTGTVAAGAVVGAATDSRRGPSSALPPASRLCAGPR